MSSTAEAASWPAVVDRPADHVTADSLPTVQIDGVAWSQAMVGDDVYVGGQFNNARPAGAAAGTNQTTRNNFLSYNITNGNLNTGFAPSLNQQVKRVAVSPDKSRVYVAGSFTSANGQNRYRLAAYNTATGALISNFAPVFNTTVTAIAVTNDTVYAAGWFSTVNGQSRQRLAAFNASNGALLAWAPTAQDDVTSMVLSPDESQVIVGGRFRSLNNSPAVGMGALDAVNGNLLPWHANTVIRNGNSQSGIQSLSVDEDTVYGTNFNYGTGNYEGVFALDPDGGAITWLADCHGDTLDAFSMNDVVYSVGHAHDCSNIYGFPDENPRGNYAAMSFSKEATGLVRKNQQSGAGYGDFEGQPAPSIYYWFPKMQPGTLTPAKQAGWTITGNGDYLSIGGEFPSVNRRNQQGLVRFAVPSEAPNDEGPLHMGSLFTTTVTPLGSAGARVSWQANEDRDDQALTYWVVRDDNPSTPIYTKTQVAPFWDRPTMQFVDTTATPGSTYRYRVHVRDGDGNQTNGDWTSVTIPSGAALSAYPLRVLQDEAQHYWRLDETSGNFADFVSQNGLTKQSGVTSSTNSALAGDANRSASFNGSSSNGSAGTATAQAGPNEFSMELWFRTNSSRGGKIMGFGSSRSGNSGSYDRHLYLDNSGRLTFGVYPGEVKTVRGADTYRDNQWHHAVATLSSAGMRLYVDGEQVAQDPSVTSAQTYNGYWRLGGDNMGSWPNGGSSAYFQGLIDEAAVYPTALSASQVGAHYALGTGQVPNEPPVADFTTSADGLTISFDAADSSDADGSIASYAWDFGDGATDTGVEAEHTYASAGSYPVTLTVTDDDGATHAVTKTVMAQVPNQGPVAAFTWQASDLDVDFDASTSTDADGEISAYAWNFGDGNEATGATPSHSYAAGGTYTVQLTVTDDDGEPAVITQEVTVVAANEAPEAQFTAATDGLTLTVDGTTSEDPDGTIAGYAWEFGDGQTGTGATTSHTYAQAGSYDVTLVVTDDKGATNAITKSFTVQLADQQPTAAFTSTMDGLTATFDGSGSADPDGTISSYAWQFGDGSSGTGVAPSHTYATAGTYEVTLTVTAADGGTATVTHPVTATAAAQGLAGDTFDRTANTWGTADLGGAWSLANPSAFSTDGSTGQLRLSQPGMSATATLNGAVTDELNMVVDISMDKVATGSGVFAMLDARRVGNSSYRLKPRLMADGVMHLALSRVVNGSETTLYEVNVPSAVYEADETMRVRFVVTGSGTTTLQGTIWKKGTEEPAPQMNRTDNTAALQGPGSIGVLGYLAGNATNAPVTLSFDNLAAWASAEAGAEPEEPAEPDPEPEEPTEPEEPVNEAPSAAFTSDVDDLTVSFDGSSSDDPDGDIASYAWDFGDDETATGATAEHTYATAGTYPVTLTVTDDGGLTDSVTHEVTVTAPEEPTDPDEPTDPEEPAEQVVVQDDFDRTGSGWATADTGGPWTLTGASAFSTDGESGQITLSSAGQGVKASLDEVSAKDVDVVMDVAVSDVATGTGIYSTVLARQVGANSYKLTLRLMADGVVHLVLDKTVNGTRTIFREVNVASVNYDADEVLRLRYRVTGDDPTTLTGTVWKAGDEEPSSPQITVSDDTEALRGPGSIALEGYVAGNATNTPVTISVDNLSVTDVGQEE